jgi:archaellum component FlaG (FlaF/FlaG flagellin family)
VTQLKPGTRALDRVRSENYACKFKNHKKKYRIQMNFEVINEPKKVKEGKQTFTYII